MVTVLFPQQSKPTKSFFVLLHNSSPITKVVRTGLRQQHARTGFRPDASPYDDRMIQDPVFVKVSHDHASDTLPFTFESQTQVFPLNSTSAMSSLAHIAHSVYKMYNGEYSESVRDVEFIAADQNKMFWFHMSTVVTKFVTYEMDNRVWRECEAVGV